MFVERHGLLVQIYCTNCRLGELMPYHPVFKKVDYYNFVTDSWLRLHKEYEEKYGPASVPIFKYRRLKERQVKYLRDHISLGEIENSP